MLGLRWRGANYATLPVSPASLFRGVCPRSKSASRPRQSLAGYGRSSLNGERDMLANFGNETGGIDPLGNEGRGLAPADQVSVDRMLEAPFAFSPS